MESSMASDPIGYLKSIEKCRTKSLEINEEFKLEEQLIMATILLANALETSSELNTKLGEKGLELVNRIFEQSKSEFMLITSKIPKN